MKLSYLVISIFAVVFSLLIDYVNLDKHFRNDIVNVHQLLLQNIANIETVLISLTAFHQASEDINSAELSSFSENILKAYPFINTILFSEKISNMGIIDFEEKMNNQGFINLKIKPKPPKTSFADKTFYLPINFIEPMSPISANALGFDLLSFSKLKQLILHSISNNVVVASEEVRLKGQRKKAHLIVKPIYLGRYPPNEIKERKRLLSGLAIVQLNLHQLLNTIHLSDNNLKAEFKTSDTLNVSLFNHLIADEYFELYGKQFSLTLIRPLTANQFNPWQLIFILVLFNCLFYFAKYFLHKRKIAEAQIKQLAYYDTLTNLPNRTNFKEQVAIAIKEAIKNNTVGAVMFMDLDEFKRINDTLGHNVGDELLIQVSNRLTQQMRTNDSIISPKMSSKDNLVTRLGGDEFTVLLTQINTNKSIANVAERLQKSISLPFILNNHEVCVTSSIGIALFPQDGKQLEEILKHADTAMYHAKEKGKNNFQFYSREMGLIADKRLMLEQKLRHAIEKNELVLHYQPQVDTHTRKIIAAEALIRWHQTELGMIMPDEFIPLAEETGLIKSIGEWVLKESCRQNKEWQSKGLKSIPIAVNVSTIQFNQKDLLNQINNALQQSKLDSQYLELEITESLMMKNIDNAIKLIKQIAKLGINVSIDDFGTGYSSLSYLKKFPLKSLKIDKSFIADISKDEDGEMITKAIILMAQSLRLKVVAEGVEEMSQLEFLKQQDCDFCQGYYFSKPLPKSEFEALLKSNSKIPFSMT